MTCKHKANGTRGEANLHNAKGSVSRGNGLNKIEDKHRIIYSYNMSSAHNFWSKPNFPLNNLTGLNSFLAATVES